MLVNKQTDKLDYFNLNLTSYTGHGFKHKTETQQDPVGLLGTKAFLCPVSCL